MIVRQTRQEHALRFSPAAGLSLLALAVQLVVPTLHHGVERGVSAAWFRAASAAPESVVSANAGLPGGHDATACATCGMLRHAGHGLPAMPAGLPALAADAGRCAVLPTSPPAEVAVAGHFTRGPPAPLS